jgi:sulfite reductase (NADPH) flavoprotein alpha-component
MVPKVDGVERLYSIAEINNQIIISVKKQEHGICSNYFSALQKGDQVKAMIKRNPSFNLPESKTNKSAVLIANGTGIGPFLGMISQSNPITKHLFWGGRTKQSLQLYKNHIDNSLKNKTLSSFHLALSQEQHDKIYVQDVVASNQDVIAQVLKDNGVIFICGSIAMQNKVLEVLQHITASILQQPLSFFEANNQIKKDCY